MLDRTLQVLERFAIDKAAGALALVEGRMAAPPRQGWAPALTVPDLLESELCQTPIDVYDRAGGTKSGCMREVDGRPALRPAYPLR